MLLEVGRVDRAHGVQGEVVVRLVTNRTERLSPGTRLHAAHGPLTVRSARPHGERWIVAFEGVADRAGAQGLRGETLRAEPVDDGDPLWAHRLIGLEVVEVGGTPRGEVVALEANPASDLLVLEGGALVPLRFVVGLDARGRIEVDAPTGLFDAE